MRRDVSDLAGKLDVSRLSGLLDLPEYKITGALKRKTLQYVCGKYELFRFDKPISFVEGGTSVFLEPYEIVRGFPKISRTLMLYPALLKHFSKCEKVVAEEKMNGYNVRLALIRDKILALTRGGFICPYTTEKISEMVNPDFFHDHPDLVLCGEMVGPDSPYVPKTFYDIDSLEFFAFDVREKNSGIPMPVIERRKLMDEYGIKSVRLFGEFDVESAHKAIAEIIKGFGETLREGVVIKDPDMVLPSVKYTSSLSNCSDLKYAFEFYNDFGRDFFFGRVCREAFQSVEWGEDEERSLKRCHELGESILLPMISTIRKKKAGDRIVENVRVRVKDLKTVNEFEDHLKLLGIDAVFEHPEKAGNEYLINIKKIHQSTNDKTETILSGQLWS